MPLKVIENYREDNLGLPYPVLICRGALEVINDQGVTEGITVTAMESLVAAIAVARCLEPTRLLPGEVRFMRHVMHMNQATLAKALGLGALETVSRWERHAEFQASVACEKLLRFVVLSTLGHQVEDFRTLALMELVCSGLTPDVVAAAYHDGEFMRYRVTLGMN